MKIYLLGMISFILGPLLAYSQPAGYSVEIETDSIQGLPGIHSYAWAKHNGLWLIVGGRTNGLHGFQPPNAFPLSTQNTTLYVVDPVNRQVWSSPTTTLGTGLREHISSSNMQFIQDSVWLYFIGGYGYSSAAGDHATFPNLTAIHVPDLIFAIQNGNTINPHFRQITDQRFAVTGGHIGKIGNRYLLAFGHRFDGRYNPNNGPSFTQTYTEEIRWFEINDNGSSITINNYVAENDPAYYHRRDYNMCPQIFPGGSFGYTGYTGVFRPQVDLPWFNSINITSAGGIADSSYQQLYNQYHTAYIALYDSALQTTYTIFFGGMGMYYYDMNNVLVQDSAVPFVQTISMISRNNSGTTESVLPIHMPGYMGSSAEFIPSDSLYFINSEIGNLNDVDSTRVLAGYIFGGIESSLPNIFMQTTGSSWATPAVTRVYLRKNHITQTTEPSPVISTLLIYPNPTRESLNVTYHMSTSGYVNISLYNINGKIVRTSDKGELTAGEHREEMDVSKFAAGEYTLVININGQRTARKISVVK